MQRPRRLMRVHQRTCRLAGLREVRMHDLRHSFATIHLYELHSPVQYVSAQLGHSSIQITVATYGHPTLSNKSSKDYESTD
jgi:integrase